MQLHVLLLIYRRRRDGRLSWPSWLIHSGQFSHKVVVTVLMVSTSVIHVNTFTDPGGMEG